MIMRRWPWIVGWLAAVTLASVVGFVAIALVGVGLAPISGSGGASLSGSVGAIGPVPSPTVGGSVPLVGATAAPSSTPGVRGPFSNGTVPDDTNDSLGNSTKVTKPGTVATSRPRTSTAPSNPGSGQKPAPAVTTVTRSVSTSGGSATARCSSDTITLTAWSPAPGYTVKEVRAGPASSIRVLFTSSSRAVEIKAECDNGAPKFEYEAHDDEGSGDN